MTKLTAVGLTIAFISAMSVPAAAAWDLSVDEDPLEDTKIAYISEVGSGAVAAFKCWENQPDETLFMLITMSPYDASADYKDEFEVIVRVDKGEKSTIVMRPRDFNGRFGLVAAQGRDTGVLTFLRGVGTAKTQIALGAFNRVMTVPIKGSKKAVDGLLKACGL